VPLAAAEANLAVETLMAGGHFSVVDHCGRAAKSQSTLQDLCAPGCLDVLASEEALLWWVTRLADDDSLRTPLWLPWPMKGAPGT
jgi:hypothetical protein